jgi:hypothetical protein
LATSVVMFTEGSDHTSATHILSGNSSGAIVEKKGDKSNKVITNTYCDVSYGIFIGLIPFCPPQSGVRRPLDRVAPDAR